MKRRPIITVDVDDQGRLLLPAGMGKRFGLLPGAKIRLEEDANSFRISRSSDNLARIYVEPTNQCNLDCVTCMRNVWDEKPGWMSEAVFSKVIAAIQGFQPNPSVFFGGYGEPLTHPRIAEMVSQAHQAGASVELITNGILLSQDLTWQLTEAGLDRLWVSIDGATSQGYADVRLGAALPEVITNLRNLQIQRYYRHRAPKLGIAIVAMKRNWTEIPEIINLGKNLGADQFSITNVYPHTKELREEMLYSRSLYEDCPFASEWTPLIDLPRLDIHAFTADSLLHLFGPRHVLSVARREVHLGNNMCPFAEKGPCRYAGMVQCHLAWPSCIPTIVTWTITSAARMLITSEIYAKIP